MRVRPRRLPVPRPREGARRRRARGRTEASDGSRLPGDTRAQGARRRDQPRRQGRQGRPAVLVHGARRRRRRGRPRRRRLRQGARGSARDHEGRRGREEEPLHGAEARSTITHEVLGRFDAARVMLRPASEGTGVIAGGGVRAVLELGGMRNVLAKRLGTTNPINMAKATVAALKELRRPEDVARIRGKQISEVLPLPSIRRSRRWRRPLRRSPAPSRDAGGAGRRAEARLRGARATSAAAEGSPRRERARSRRPSRRRAPRRTTTRASSRRSSRRRPSSRRSAGRRGCRRDGEGRQSRRRRKAGRRRTTSRWRRCASRRSGARSARASATAARCARSASARSARSAEQEEGPVLAGMLRKVRHLVKVEEASYMAEKQLNLSISSPRRRASTASASAAASAPARAATPAAASRARSPARARTRCAPASRAARCRSTCASASCAATTSKDAMPVGPFRTYTQPVNVRDLDRFDAGAEVTPESLVEKRPDQEHEDRREAPRRRRGLEEAHRPRARASRRRAREKIEAAGGTVELLREPKVKKAQARRSAKPAADAAPGADEPEATEAAATDETPSDRGRDHGGISVLSWLANAWRVPELRRRVLFTAAMLAVYRLGSWIPRRASTRTRCSAASAAAASSRCSTSSLARRSRASRSSRSGSCRTSRRRSSCS